MSLVDAAARDQALDPQQSFIVQAPAGSGKTGLLVRRILELLCVVEKPEEILAITFTRKATSEMRERVIKALYRARDGGKFEDHELDIEPRAHAVLARDTEKQWQLLEQTHRLKIQTIDSLCSELVRKMPWSTRFGGMPQIETDLKNLYEQAAQSLIEGIDRAPLQAALTTLLTQSGGNIQSLKSQLANMLYQRDSWLSLLYGNKALDSRSTIEHNWRQLTERSITALMQAFGASTSTQLLELAHYAHLNLADGSDESRCMLDALQDTSRQPELDTQILQWRAITQLVTTGSGIRNPRSVNKTLGFPIKDPAKLQLQELLAALAEDSVIYQLVEHFRQCPRPELSDDDWARLQALRKVLPALAQELYLQMAERGYTDYDELSRRAIDALGEADQPTDLALIQDYRLKHILMDEFQDTSPTQLVLLERLTAGWQVDDGRTLFFVGDPMQSIYGFRKADVRVFLQVRDEGINDIKPRSLNLSVNFRSSPDIVNWVNRTMVQVFPAKDVPEIGKVRYTQSTAFKSSPGGVHYHLCIAQTAVCERDEIVKIIEQITAAHPHEQIAVLARKRVPLAALASRLRESALAFEAVDMESLAEQTIVQDLISLSAVFLQPMDTLAWLAVLRAPWCGLCLNDLTVLRQTGISILQLLQEDKLPPGLSEPGSHALNRVRNVILPTLQYDRESLLDERVRRAWLGLRAPACYARHELDHAQPFFELLSQLQANSPALNRAKLHQACAQNKSSSPASNIKLMTLHKAKGLEFDHVILIGLAAKSGGDNRQQPLLLSTPKDDLLLLAPRPVITDTPPNKASFIKQYRQSIEDEEAARLLYVAVTRAKQQLYLFGTLKKTSRGNLSAPQRGSLLHLLWDELGQTFLESEHYIESGDVHASDTPEPAKRPGVPLYRLPESLPKLNLPGAIEFIPDTNSGQTQQLEFDWAREDARIIGLVVHQILEFTDHAQIQHWKISLDVESLAASLRNFGLPAERITQAAERTRNILQQMAQDERARWIFDPKHQEVKSEWALSCHQQQQVAHYIIDRSFIDAQGIRWIVDFKTSSHQGGNVEGFLDSEALRYADQLDRYAELVQTLEPGREIRLGLYFPALTAWRERRYEASNSE